MQLGKIANQENINSMFILNEKPSDNDAKYLLVQIPILQNSATPYVYVWATQMHEMGSTNLYKIDDTVLVEFINMDLRYPVILGKFLKTSEETGLDSDGILKDDRINKSLDQLTVYNETKLLGTEIILNSKYGSMTSNDLWNSIDQTNDNKKDIAGLKLSVNSLNKKMDKVEDNVNSLWWPRYTTVNANINKLQEEIDTLRATTISLQKQIDDLK